MLIFVILKILNLLFNYSFSEENVNKEISIFFYYYKQMPFSQE